MARRKYKTGTRWCVWRWTETDSEYITRLHILKTPFFALCLHWLNKPDPEPYLHDHPVSFLSIILRGEYSEKRVRKNQSGSTFHYETHRWFNWIPATPEDRHTITHVKPKTLTLCFMGPKVRTWGFHRPEGWQSWQDYYAEQRSRRKRS